MRADPVPGQNALPTASAGALRALEGVLLGVAGLERVVFATALVERISAGACESVVVQLPRLVERRMVWFRHDGRTVEARDGKCTRRGEVLGS